MMKQVKIHPIYTSVAERFAGDLHVSNTIRRQLAQSRMGPYFKQPELPADIRYLEHYITEYERAWK